MKLFLCLLRKKSSSKKVKNGGNIMYHKSLRNYISIIRKKNIKLKTGVALFIVLICLLVTGCSQAEPQDKNKELIQDFLEF